jgi:hypothetical protein
MTDLADDVTDNRPQGNIMDQIKSSPTTGNTDESKVTATVQSSKLKNMLAGLKGEG